MRAGLVLLASAGATACVGVGDPGRPTTIWETQLTPAVAFPELSGRAAAVSGDAGTVVGLAIDGAAPGAEHAWGVRLGTCVTPGAQIGPDTDYPALVVSDSGKASVETHIGTRLASTGRYHVSVRLSATDTARTACGDLVER